MIERRSSTKTIFLQAKHYCLWQELKTKLDGCETITVTNPKTKLDVIKHGNAYHTVQGRVTKVVKYDTGDKFSTRYFGFKMTLEDGGDFYVFDMPYNSQALRRFLSVAPNVDWAIPLSITVFKGKKQGNHSGAEPTVVWFRQRDETVKSYFTKDAPNGMPPATQDPHSKEWDFKVQRRWLVDYFLDNIAPAIEEAAKKVAPPLEPESAPERTYEQEPPAHDDAWDAGITDDDVPF